VGLAIGYEPLSSPSKPGTSRYLRFRRSRNLSVCGHWTRSGWTTRARALIIFLELCLIVARKPNRQSWPMNSGAIQEE
jgi:hypothetical protein